MGTLYYFQMPVKNFWEWEMPVFKKERKWISPTWLVLSGVGKSLVGFEKSQLSTCRLEEGQQGNN